MSLRPSKRISALIAYRTAFGVLGETVRAIHLLRVPVLAATGMVVLFAAGDQVREIYRVLAEDIQLTWSQCLLTYLAALVASLLIWYSGRWLSLVCAPDNVGEASWFGSCLRWLPQIAATAPLLALAVGLWVVSHGRELRGNGPSILALRAGSAALAVTTAALVVGLYVKAGPTSPMPGLFGRRSRLTILGLTAVVASYFATLPIAGPQTIGAIAVALLFFSFVTYWASWLSYHATRLRVPIVGALIVLALAWSALDWNDNHRFRHEPTVATPWDQRMPAPLPISEAFEAWLQSRRDLSQFERYPVILVAAQGGGLYAAYNAATVLSRLQDRCPSFAQHVFAISGVSGGSLGAAVFTALAAHHAKNDVLMTCAGPTGGGGDELEQRTHVVLNRDFLAPVVAATLFPDFFQRFLPFPVGAFDRARALEYAWEDAWARAHPPIAINAFQQPLRELWNPGAATPLLVLNATQVETGDRLSVTSVLLPPPHLSVAALRPDAKVPLSVAVGLSARFPFVTPAGWFHTDVNRLETGGSSPPVKRRLADGGYFDNSGMATALDIYVEIAATHSRRGASSSPVRLIILHIGSAPGATPSGYALDEAVAPLRTLFKAREARGRSAVTQAQALADLLDEPDPRPRPGGLPRFAGGTVRAMILHGGRFSLPLGWQLSTVSRRLIADQSGRPERCDPHRQTFDNTAVNDCIALSIHRLLMPDRDALGEPSG